MAGHNKKARENDIRVHNTAIIFSNLCLLQTTEWIKIQLSSNISKSWEIHRDMYKQAASVFLIYLT